MIKEDFKTTLKESLTDINTAFSVQNTPIQEPLSVHNLLDSAGGEILTTPGQRQNNASNTSSLNLDDKHRLSFTGTDVFSQFNDATNKIRTKPKRQLGIKGAPGNYQPKKAAENYSKQWDQLIAEGGLQYGFEPISEEN